MASLNKEDPRAQTGLFKEHGGETQSRLKLNKPNDTPLLQRGGRFQYHRRAPDLLGVQLGRFLTAQGSLQRGLIEAEVQPVLCSLGCTS